MVLMIHTDTHTDITAIIVITIIIDSLALPPSIDMRYMLERLYVIAADTSNLIRLYYYLPASQRNMPHAHLDSPNLSG